MTAYPLPERARRVVSPELVLVDPALAAAERSLLPKVSSFRDSVRPRPAPPFVEQRSTVVAAPAFGECRWEGRRSWTPQGWPRLAGVAAVTVLALLLLDMRVHVGRTPAAAEATDPRVHLGSPEQVAPRRATKPKPDRGALARSGGKTKRGNPATAATRQRITRATEARRFAWAPVPGADSYLVELYLREARVLTATSRRPEITVPANWRYDGRRRSLVAGEYRWYVWAVDSGKRASTAVVQATLTIP